MSDRSQEKTIDFASSLIASDGPQEHWLWRICVFLGYLLCGVLFTWPLTLHLGESVIQKGDLPVDSGQNIWNLWWTHNILLRADNPFITRMLFYPETINLFYQTLTIPDALLAAPVLILKGPVAAYNSIVLLSFGLTGYFSYRLTISIVGNRFAALIAGFVFACAPFRMQQIYGGSLERIATYWLVLYVLLLMRALARRTLVSVFSAALCLFVTTLACRYYGLYAAVYTPFHVVLAALLASPEKRRVILLIGTGVGVTWAVLLTPLLLWVGAFGGVEIEDWYMRQVFHSVALVDLISLNVLHPFWGSVAETWLSQYHPGGVESGAGLGLGTGILIGLALWRHWRFAWPWALLLLMMLLLAMGPQVRLTENESALPGPFLILDLFSFFRNASRPSLFVAVMLIPVTVLVALGITALSAPGDQGFRNVSRFRAGILAALVIFEYLVEPWPLIRVRSAPESLLLNADPVPGAVLELPPQLDQSEGLLNQICHGRPLMGGYLARTPFYPIVAASSATRNLWQAREPIPDIVLLDPAAELASLGTRFVVLDLTHLSQGARDRLRRQLAVPGIDRFLVNETREIYVVNPAFARPVVVPGAGWYEAEHEGMRRWRWMGDQAEMVLLTREQAIVAVSWRATAYGASRILHMRQGNRLLNTLDVPAAPYSRMITLRLIIPPGRTILRLESTAERVSDGRRLSLSIQDLRITALPVTDAWRTAVQHLDIPTTRPAIAAPPCR
jgi:hypothetical protein